MSEKGPEFNQQKIEQKEKEPEIQIERITDLDDGTLKQISEVEKSCFPEQIAEDEEELREVLENPEGIHLKIKDEEGKIFGYISSLRQDQEFDLLKKHDLNLKKEDGVLYVHSFDIVPGKRSLRTFNRAWNALKEEAVKEEYKKLIMYARTSNGLSRVFQKRYGAEFFRRIENWRGLGEPFDYLEIELPEKKRK